MLRCRRFQNFCMFKHYPFCGWRGSVVAGFRPESGEHICCKVFEGKYLWHIPVSNLTEYPDKGIDITNLSIYSMFWNHTLVWQDFIQTAILIRYRDHEEKEFCTKSDRCTTSLLMELFRFLKCTMNLKTTQKICTDASFWM